MVSFDRERTEDRAVELLTDLSLTDYEARTFVGLLRLGRGSAREVSDVVEVPRSRVYDAVESLHEMGLVDIRYGTPKEFIPVSHETTVRKFVVRYEDLTQELSDVLNQLNPTGRETEQIGVWTVTGSKNITRRVVEFINDAKGEIILMSDEALLTDEITDALVRAKEKERDVYVTAVDSETEDVDSVPSDSTVVETFWTWSRSHISRILLVNDEVTLVSVEQQVGDGETAEVAIWGRGTKNNLVVVLRTILAVQFGEDREAFETGTASLETTDDPTEASPDTDDRPDADGHDE
ncbi:MULTISPECIES: TrmB family transcriptional regulator [Haloferax]|uniref:TrmB family transcriptional regulator n=1 Tax=Haloferax marinum TaxID=2666143 RepID=A0A6A8G8N1_9EURY|nr:MULTISPECIES: helix-turn-helix domain-containing protein [Haloferax]KAB1198037.1 TrmB family transcriptional regulator [Haloferax sp. CBA1150]MRW97105.1 TrmB family transcriptional regulator [Haloferax marinum]